jgi:hypothetical protein
MLLHSGRFRPCSQTLDLAFRLARDKLSSLLARCVSNKEKNAFNVLMLETFCFGQNKLEC